MAEFDPPDNEVHSYPTAPLVVGILGLAVFLAVQALALRSFARHETRPPAWDQSVHLEIALDYRNAWADRDLSKIWSLGPKPGMPPFPPLYHLGMALLTDPARPVETSLRVNWVYLAFLSLAVFLIAYEFNPTTSALLGAIVFASTPVVQRLYHTQLVDLALAACTGMAYWALLKSQGFKRWPGSIGFGVLFAVGMMHKWSFFLYMTPAYFMAAGGLFERRCRFKVLLAAALALGGCLPWYVSHLPILVPRLLEASTDFGVPVWKGIAFFHYFLESINSLGVLFWAMGWLSICLPDALRNRERWWVLPTWTFFSYFFWALVPNRQMRFLLPGLLPLGACIAIAPWPKPVLFGAAVFEVLLSINFSTGWIVPVTLRMPLQPVELTPSYPPRREDWKLGDILREAQSRRDKGAPFSNLTLVANDTYFNGPNFTWTVKQEKVEGVNIRGVNSRLCEFSEFIALKTGTLGAPQVINRLPEAASLIQNATSWVALSYEPVARWPLPDQSEAVLYQQRKIRKPAFGELASAALSYMQVGRPDRGRKGPVEKQVSYEVYTSTPIIATDLKVRFGPWNAQKGAFESLGLTGKEGVVRTVTVHEAVPGVADMSVSYSTHVVASDFGIRFGPWDPEKGVFESVGIFAKAAAAKGVAVSSMDVVMEGLHFFPLVDKSDPDSPYIYDVRLLKLARLKIRSVSVSSEVLKDLLERRIKGLSISRLDLDKKIVLDATIKGMAVHAELAATLRDSPRRLVIDLQRAEAGVTPIPNWVLGSLSSIVVPLEPNPETPFFIDLPSLTLANGRLSVP
ncbi:MAG: glycosyltransferase family 39 protein [Elusimicrobia bacterium]|nr:glycosyltransferase family 39 protein [Elusimicrobiota bacterium]